MADNKQDKGLLTLIGKLPEELQEEGSTGRDLIDSIIHEARNEERGKILKGLRLLLQKSFGLKDAISAIEDVIEEQALKGG